jgi:hypothetical protein
MSKKGKKMIKLMFKGFIIAVLFLFTANAYAQDCAEYVNSQSINYGYNFNAMSKSGAVKTGKKYKFVFTLNKGKIYRFSFYATSNLNNGMEFTVTDANSGQKILYLPGEVPEESFDDPNAQSDYSGYDDYGNANAASNKTKAATVPVTPQYQAIEGISFKAILKADYYLGHLTYPFFEFKPANAMNLEVLIDIKELPDDVIKKGCLGILVQDKNDDAEFQSL